MALGICISCDAIGAHHCMFCGECFCDDHAAMLESEFRAEDPDC